MPVLHTVQVTNVLARVSRKVRYARFSVNKAALHRLMHTYRHLARLCLTCQFSEVATAYKKGIMENRSAICGAGSASGSECSEETSSYGTSTFGQ